ncbi:amidohydrolase family protein [Parapedobacter lycopersici]|uniref:amidohydrolase family protein n=1 Tax=Parapedobacter lycopersici TaxID=1864939 RepID=UPI00214DC43F|nr:amidohydrolase family protein [Parapedobacter lycopersici]
MQRIDAHQHFWEYRPDRDTWITDEMSVIRRDFLPADLKPLLEAQGIAGCVAVQADQSESETLFLLDLAARHDWIRGVVGWIDLRAPDVGERLAYFSQYPKLKGFRHIVQDEADPRFLLHPDWLNGIDALGRYDYTYDILVKPHQLAMTDEFIAHFPQQRFIVDHLAKPLVRSGERREWASAMEAIAQHRQVYCKLSGLITESDLTSWKTTDFDYYINHIIEVFGADRILFGSDWPVCLLAGSYRDVTALMEHAASQLSPAERALVWYTNAVNFYKL